MNTDNVRRVVKKGHAAVLEFVDGAALFINITMDEWMAMVDPPPLHPSEPYPSEPPF